MNYQMLLERMTRSHWEHISPEDAAALEKLLVRVEKLEAGIQNYTAVFGDIVFPDKSGNGQSTARREIYANPAGWMFSFDGVKWEAAPMDIGKIDYPRALFRRIPEGVSIGVTEDVKMNPQNYLFSTNGSTWNPLCKPDSSTWHTWIYHGRHNTTWFKRK